MLRDGVWHSYDKDNVWLSFDALKVTHRVNEVISGYRYSITLYTPGKLDRLTPSDWDTLSRLGFPVYLYDVASMPMRRLEGGKLVPVCQAQPLSQNTSRTGTMEAPKATSANAASSSSPPDAGADPWKNIPLPSIADASDPKTLLACCKCAREFSREYDLSEGEDALGINILRTLEYRRKIMEEFDEMSGAAKDKNWGEYLLGMVSVLYLVCNLTEEAGLESALSAAFSLKHVTNMKKSFPTQEEALDKVKEPGLSPEAAMKCIQNTPSGRFILYVKSKFVKPPDFKHPNVDCFGEGSADKKNLRCHVSLTKTSIDS